MARRTKRYAKKPGRYGTLYRYRIRYRDDDPGCPDFTHCVWAYSREHAEELFCCAPDGDGWRIISMARVEETA